MDRTTNNWLAALVCAAAGVSIATLPHFLAWATTGRPDYVSTSDERYYLAVASQAYFNHPGKLADPVFAGEAPNLYRALSILPGVWAAKLLGLGPLGISLMWRLLGGATIGLAWFVLFHNRFRRPWVAAALSVILLSDPGLCRGLPLVRYPVRLLQFASAPRDSPFASPWIHLEWRVVSPAMTMVYLVGLMWAVSRARAIATRERIVLAGLAFGLLYYVFFYYWTAVGLALLLALALDTGHRRIYFHAGWIGGLLGLPAIVSDFSVKQRISPDWFLRCDRFLPIARFTELELPLDILVVTVAGFAWVWFRRRDLVFIWALGASGLMLANNQIITGLQFENWHWMYVWGPAFSFFILLVAAEELGDRLSWSPRAHAALAVVTCAAFGVGTWIRAMETTRCADPVHNGRVLAAYRAEFHSGRPVGFAANSVAAGAVDFVEFAAILDNLRPFCGYSVYLSPSVSEAELDERSALNDILLGIDRATFESERAFPERVWSVGPWRRDRSLIPLRAAARVAAYDRIRADLPAALDRYAIRYVALPAGTKPDHLARGWALCVTGSTWDIWERTTASRMPPGQSLGENRVTTVRQARSR
jgi:hypothetical protein